MNRPGGVIIWVSFRLPTFLERAEDLLVGCASVAIAAGAAVDAFVAAEAAVDEPAVPEVGAGGLGPVEAVVV